MEFNAPLQDDEEDVNLSWLPLHLALGQHTQSVHTVTALDWPVYFASLQTQTKKSMAAHPPSVALFFSLLTQILWLP